MRWRFESFENLIGSLELFQQSQQFFESDDGHLPPPTDIFDRRGLSLSRYFVEKKSDRETDRRHVFRRVLGRRFPSGPL